MFFGKKSNEENDSLTMQIEQLEKQNKLMRVALEFYAEANHWEAGHKYRDADDATIFTDGDNSAATVDNGKKASRALRKIKKPQ